jgi:hypothetical protein
LHDIDVLMLCECGKPYDLLKTLNRDSDAYFYSKNNIGDKVKIFAKLDKNHIKPLIEDNRIAARDLVLPNSKNITLIVAHLPSKLNKSESSQYASTERVRDFVSRVEKEQKHKRTIFCGDFNMNPFEVGMIQTVGLHTVMEKKIAKKVSRTVDDKVYPYFYNPMWGFLGDLGRGVVSGTYYYSNAEDVVYHWHLFDQVIMRPEIIPIFEDNKLDIITEINDTNLLNKNGIIDKTKFSDHLPIKFTLNI